MDWREYFQGKKITVMGLGLLGRGVGDAAFLAEQGADLIITDLKSQTDLADSVARLEAYPNIKWTLGEHKEEDFIDRDLILVAAGVPDDSPYLMHASEAGVRLVQSAALFTELARIPVIGVTGTRGKSTVTAMIHHVLETATGEKVIKGGNVRGVSNLQLLNEAREDSLAVLELDSWQLQGFGWAGISPQVAVFTNFMEDHLNYYLKGGRTMAEAMDAYFADKANIFINQEDSGVLVTTPAVFERAQEFAAGKSITLGQEVVLVDSSILPEDALLPQPGEHNRLNAALAIAACRQTGLSDEEIFAALASYTGVEGRLQLLATRGGVKIYNDNNATTPTATTEGVKAVANGKNVVLIAGGTDKGVDVGQLPMVVDQYVSHLILYSGTGTEKLKAELSPEVSLEEHVTLRKCVEAAIATAAADDVILFSPGFASFGEEFKNEYDRNDQFVALVREFE